ncbi:MAG: phospho-N-acetylmuramoyl-pentapeptide-transferase [Lachnospiraceae bacterium]|nr:phospho-N-acetylmuramoyl-pentapeptide-transferase [Lachnospiraceae bacterium]
MTSGTDVFETGDGIRRDRSMEEAVKAIFVAIVAFAAAFLLLKVRFSFLPVDGGKTAVRPDGTRVDVNAASKGKTTGVGVVFTIIWYAASLIFYGVSKEMLLYLGALLAMTLSGFLDDRSAIPWKDYIKAIIDAVIVAAVVAVFLLFHDPDVYFLNWHFRVPVALYAVLAFVLLWVSVNVTNCSDGVDGLCGGVTSVELLAFVLIFSEISREYKGMAAILIGVLIAYLFYNWFPSTLLMGDGGSRPIGLFLGLLAMLSRHPFAFLLLSFVFIFDGGIGLGKVFLKRYLKIVILEKIRFPFHDELRKNRGWPVQNVSLFAIGMEIVFAGIMAILYFAV